MSDEKIVEVEIERLITFKNHPFKCIIKNVLGRGASCIVYDAVRITDTGDESFYRVK